jgi:hypothetical protein
MLLSLERPRSLVGLAPQLKLARQTLITSRITRRATMTRFSSTGIPQRTLLPRFYKTLSPSTEQGLLVS